MGRSRNSIGRIRDFYRFKIDGGEIKIVEVDVVHSATPFIICPESRAAHEDRKSPQG
jgi:hypothetical protein